MDYSQGFLDEMNAKLTDGYVGELDKQLGEVISGTFLSPQEALLVMMESMLDLFHETDSHRVEMKFSDTEGCHFKFTLEINAPAVF